MIGIADDQTLRVHDDGGVAGVERDPGAVRRHHVDQGPVAVDVVVEDDVNVLENRQRAIVVEQVADGDIAGVEELDSVKGVVQRR